MLDHVALQIRRRRTRRSSGIWGGASASTDGVCRGTFRSSKAGSLAICTHLSARATRAVGQRGKRAGSVMRSLCVRQGLSCTIATQRRQEVHVEGERTIDVGDGEVDVLNSAAWHRQVQCLTPTAVDAKRPRRWRSRFSVEEPRSGRLATADTDLPFVVVWASRRRRDRRCLARAEQGRPEPDAGSYCDQRGTAGLLCFAWKRSLRTRSGVRLPARRLKRPLI